MAEAGIGEDSLAKVKDYQERGLCLDKLTFGELPGSCGLTHAWAL